ncbi:MAG: hypothetical protein ACK55I_26005, partial [bacterium]
MRPTRGSCNARHRDKGQPSATRFAALYSRRPGNACLPRAQARSARGAGLPFKEPGHPFGARIVEARELVGRQISRTPRPRARHRRG